MRGIASILLASSALLWAYEAQGQSALEKAQRDELTYIPDDDPHMAAAFRKARATLADFFALAKNPKPSMSSFAVKVCVPDDRGSHECMWIAEFERKGDQFSGQIDSTPRDIKRLKSGDTIQFKEAEIADWMYMDKGRMKGNFTACAMLKHETKVSADAFMRHFGLECQL